MGKKNTANFSNVLKIVGMLALITWAVLSLGRSIGQTLSATGGNDFYTYWYAGHFIREAKDYYKTFQNDELPVVPVHYLDRVVDSLDEVVFPGLVPAPASTAPVFFFMVPLAFFSWGTAKVIWMILNLLLLGLIPFLLIASCSKTKWLNHWEVLGLICAVVGLSSSRFVMASGQLTFLFFDLILLTVILSDRKPVLAGLLLGLALSKYSLSVGILILFLFIEPKFRLVNTACLVQLGGIFGLMILSGSGFVEVIGEYLQMALWHAGREGIQLATLLHANAYWGWVALILSIGIGFPLALWRWKLAHRQWRQPLPILTRYHLLIIMLLWALLIGYHRTYDAMIMIVFFTLVAYLVKRSSSWNLNRQVEIGIKIYSAFAWLLLMLPSGNLARGFLPPGINSFWSQVFNPLTTIIIFISLILTVYLLFHIHPENNLIIQPLKKDSHPLSLI